MKNNQTVVINVNDVTAFELCCSLSEKINPKQNRIKIRILNRNNRPEKEISMINPEFVINLKFEETFSLLKLNFIKAEVREKSKESKIFAVSLLSIFEYEYGFNVIRDHINSKNVHELPIIFNPHELIQKINVPAVKVTISGNKYGINEQWENIVNGLKQAILDYFEKE